MVSLRSTALGLLDGRTDPGWGVFDLRPPMTSARVGLPPIAPREQLGGLPPKHESPGCEGQHKDQRVPRPKRFGDSNTAATASAFSWRRCSGVGLEVCKRKR